MSPRIISPPLEEWDALPTPLTAGERQVAEFFDRHLPAGWEIYVQPHLNGLQPDFVLLHPNIGIAVYEVKDWNSAERYRVERRAGIPTLTLYPKANRPVPLFGKDNPFLRVRDYKRHIHRMATGSIVGPAGNDYAGYGRITAGIVFTIGHSKDWKSLGSPFAEPGEPNRYYPVVGQDALCSGQIGWVFPEAANPRFGLMTEQIAESLRVWLREPDFVRQQRQPLPLNARQLLLVNSRPRVTGLRRLRGPAGSGKSLVLAARAARVALDGGRVLVVGFNITLSHYLRDLAVRHLRQLADSPAQYRAAYRRMIFTHFHAYKSLYKSLNDDFGDDVPIKFNAIMVDEGQDFEITWWKELQGALMPGGEMMLAFDKTQDIYRRAGAWTEHEMQGSGFRGPWNELTESYRCHTDLIPALEYYANRFMRNFEVDLPRPLQEGFHTLTLRWVQLGEHSHWIGVCLAELKRLVDLLPQDSSISDIVCLIPEHLEGHKFVNSVMEQFKISHIFSEHPKSDVRQRQSRSLKHQFWAGNGMLKAVTMHSFKGWESRHMLIYIDDIWKTKAMPAIFYTALTRLLSHVGGSCLTVVSTCPELRDFGRKFFSDFAETSDPIFYDADDLPF